MEKKPRDLGKDKGAVGEAAGTVREARGRLTGNEKLQAAGRADKVGGHARDAVGDVKNEVAYPCNSKTLYGHGTRPPPTLGGKPK